MKFQNVNSSAIKAIAYEENDLYIVFNNADTIYKYEQVPQNIYQKLLNSESLGKAFNILIKNHWEGEYAGMFKDV